MTGTSVPRSYNGTNSVGDFLNITLDPATQTVIYANRFQRRVASSPYTVNADGTYALNDPHGNLVAAYEVPNYALMLQAAETGPNHDIPVLVTAVEKESISVATWTGKEYNYSFAPARVAWRWDQRSWMSTATCPSLRIGLMAR